MQRRGFTLIELLVVIVIIGILVAIALPNFIKIKDKAKEAEVKQNCHAVQLALERYAVDSIGEHYPMYVMGGDWTDSYVVWQYWVDLQGLDPSTIQPPERGTGWIPADTDVGDSLVMEAYMPSYPENPFMKNSKTQSLLPTIPHYPRPGTISPFTRIVGGREASKMYEVFGPDTLLGSQSCQGDYFVHHIFNNPPYDALGDVYKTPDNGWKSPSGNKWLIGNFSYWPRAAAGSAFPMQDAGDPVGYTVAGYGSVRTPGQDVYNRNGNYKGRFRTETCETNCYAGGGVPGFEDSPPCICAQNGNEGSPPSILANNGGSDTVPDGVVITLDSGVDKKSQKVNNDTTEGE